MRFFARFLPVLAVSLSFAAAPAFSAGLPPAEHNLVLEAPVHNWDEGIPLGNGLSGGLLFGGGRELILGLDRGDLWDERPAPGVGAGWWRKHPWSGDPHASWETAYQGASPTKLPGGQVRIAFPEGHELKKFQLDFARAEGRVETSGGGVLRAVFHATESVALLEISGVRPESIRVLSPLKVAGGGSAGTAGHSPGSVNQLGYPAALSGKEGAARWYVQRAAGGFSYCVCLESKDIGGGGTLVAVAIGAEGGGWDPLPMARSRCARALAGGYEKAVETHREWWREFWASSSLRIPRADIQRQYVFNRYLYGAGSRRGAPPMPLQGVWTANDGKLPPWKGDYHNDLNTQMTYIAYFASGDFDAGGSFLDYLWERRKVFRDFASDFYGTDGLSVPGVMTLAGQPLGGWPQYSLSPTNTAWNAHQFYLHWRYTMDDVFLRERAWPWCSEAGKCLAALLKPDENGVLKLPRSSSPEIHDNSARAWMTPNTNYDNMCLRMLFLSLAEMADAQQFGPEADGWRALADGLGPWHVTDDGVLKLSAEETLNESHRHLSNLMGFHPFNLITCEGGPEHEKMIAASLKDWERFGTRAWVGYSFSWMSCLRARTGDAEGALHFLDIYTRAFVSRNGFHLNGDQIQGGYSGFSYRPFTLEGNFLAMQAVHEMLLQSWSPTPGRRDTEVIRIFPAMPESWREAAFDDLRAEGGHRVSAVRKDGATSGFHITAGKDGLVRIRDNFGSAALEWSHRDVRKTGGNYEIELKKGERLSCGISRKDEL